MIEVKNTLEGKLNASIVKEYPELEDITVTPTLEEQKFKSNKYGYDDVTVKGIEAEKVTVIPSKEEQIKEGLFDEVIVKAIETQDLNITPQETTQAYNGLYENISVEKINTEEVEIELDFSLQDTIEVTNTTGKYITKVTINKDTDLIPENIRSGVNIFGTDGNLEIKETTKGIIINECDENGYPVDVSIVGMTEIPDYYLYCRSSDTTSTFSYCSKVNLPEEVTYIGNYAFQCCSNLAITKLPSEVEEIGMGCFGDCPKLAITEMPSKLEMARNNAFQNCTGLTEITWPGSTVKMGTRVFSGCTNLQKFVMPNITSIPTLNSTNVFTSTPIASGTGYIYVPDNLVDSFKTATNWSTYADQIKGVSELV